VLAWINQLHTVPIGYLDISVSRKKELNYYTDLVVYGQDVGHLKGSVNPRKIIL